MAFAAVANRAIYASMHAATILVGTLINTTAARRLVFTIRTVLVPVAHLGQGNTKISSAIKLAGGVTALSLCDNLAILLVTTVRTVPLTIAG